MLINDIVYNTRANDFSSPEFNYCFVADIHCDNDEEKKFFSELLQQACLIPPRSKPSPCQKLVN